MELHVNGRTFDVSQLGPDFVRDGIAHPLAEGEMIVSIDGHVKRWPVRLRWGGSWQGKTRLADCPRANGSRHD